MLRQPIKMWPSISQKIKTTLTSLNKRNRPGLLPLPSSPYDFAPFLIDYLFLYHNLNPQQHSLAHTAWLLKCIRLGETLIEPLISTERQIELVLSDGRSIIRSYDEFGRLKKVICPDKTEVVREYDDRGNLSATFHPNGTIRYHYDLLDRLIKIRCLGGKEISYVWDSGGNIKNITYTNGEKADFYWDANNRLVGIVDSFGTVEYKLDKLGNLSAITYPSGINYSFDYDKEKERVFPLEYDYTSKGSVSRIISPFGISLFDDSGNILSRIDINGQKTLFRYSQNGQLKHIETPLGITIFNYDSSGRLTAIIDPWGMKSILGYNSKGQLEEVRDNFGVGRCEYNKRGKPYRIIREKNVKFILKYNSKGRVKNINTLFGAIRCTYNKEASHIIFPDNSGVNLHYDNSILKKITVSEGIVFLNAMSFLEILLFPQVA